jgi:hypothetical protein
LSPHDRAAAQDVVGITAIESADEASLRFELVGDQTLMISLSHGTLSIGGSPVATYPEGGRFEQQWRELVDKSADFGPSDFAASLERFDLESASESQRAGFEALRAAVVSLATVNAVLPEVLETLPQRVAPPPRAVDVTVARGVPSQAIVVDVASPGFVGGLVGGAMNLIAAYVALAFISLGLLFFAPKQLETVADTVWHSFGRSFLAGLFAQPLILPVFAMMIVGLVLTVVGIVVVPFAVSAFIAALLLAVLGGFVAIARTVGEIYLRRRMARGEAVSTWGSYRYVVYGLVGVLAIWLPTILLGWIPVAGTLLTITAAACTWVLATAGFGAAIISRGGLRGTFVRQIDLALTDEQFWTDEAMPTPIPRRAARRPQ